LRIGPLVYRSANSSRLAQGSSPFLRAASLPNLHRLHLRPRRGFPFAAPVPLWEASRLELESWLPINLREFLAEHLGSRARVEDDAIVALTPGSGEQLMSDLARAIRRFSTGHAHEAWNRCTVRLAELEGECRNEDTPLREVVLCLGCARLEIRSGGALDRHREEGCVPVLLSSAKPCASQHRLGAFAHTYPAEGAHRAIQSFRTARAASGLPHFDLDCYVANGKVVFTWRPLPNESGVRVS
jgi:hypothetical protein